MSSFLQEQNIILIQYLFYNTKRLSEKRHIIGTGTRCPDRNKGAVPEPTQVDFVQTV